MPSPFTPAGPILPLRQAFAYGASIGSSGYFVATNPTPGTAIQSDLITAFSATGAGDLVVTNTAPLGSGINIYLDYVKKMMTGTAPTGTTVQRYAGYIEPVLASGVPSAGSVAITPVNINGGSAQTFPGSVYLPTGGAAMTIPAASTTRRLACNGSIPTSLGITGDEYILQFGSVDATSTAIATAVRATAAARLATTVAPVVIGPQQAFILDFWWLTQAANKPNWEWEIGMWVY